MFGAISLTPANAIQQSFAEAFAREDAVGVADSQTSALGLADLFAANASATSFVEAVEFSGSYNGNFVFGAAQNNAFINDGAVMGLIDLGLGDDTYFGSAGSIVDGGIELGVGNDIAETGMADDTVFGGLGDDLVDGGAGNDLLVGDDVSAAAVQNLLAELGL